MKIHKEAIIAKWIYDNEGRVGEHAGDEISHIDFYNSLDSFEKSICKQAIDEIESIKERAVTK